MPATADRAMAFTKSLAKLVARSGSSESRALSRKLLPECEWGGVHQMGAAVSISRQAFAFSVKAGIRKRRCEFRLARAIATLTCSAVGTISLDDWPILTSSLGCTGSLQPIGVPIWLTRFA